MWCSTCREIRIQFPSEVNNEYFGTCRNCQMTKNQNDNDNNSQNIIILPVEYRHARKPIISRNLDVDHDDSLDVLYEYEPSVTNSNLSRNETNSNKQKHKSRNKNYNGPELRTWEELIELQAQFNENRAEEEVDFSHNKDIQEHYRRSNPIYQESSSNINLARTARQKHELSKLNKCFFDLSISPKTSRKFQDTSTETDADCTTCHDSASQTPTYQDASTMPYSGQIDESVSTGSYPQLTGWNVIYPKVKTKKSQTDNDNDNENMKTCGVVIDTESENSMSLLSGTEKQFLKNVKFATVQDEHSEILETDDSLKVVIQSPSNFEKHKQNIEPTTVPDNSNLESGDALANNGSRQSEIGEEFSVTNDDDKSTVDRFINYLKNNPGLSLQDIHKIVNGLNVTNEKKENNVPDLADYNCQVDTKFKQPFETISEILETSNAYRSNFQPISDIDNIGKDVPRQFELIKTIFPTTETYSNYKNFTQNKIPSVEELKIIRDPFRCPIANCTDSIFLREIACHIKICHSKTPIQRIRPGKKYSVFIDPKVDRLNLNKCHFLFLLCDKIRNFGKNEFKDYLPVLFMTTKIDLCQLMKIENKEVQNLIANNSEKEEFLAIWVIGFMPTDFRLNYCISAWPRYSKIPECHITRSNWVYSVQNPHDIRNLYKKGQLIMLSPLQCNQLTDNGKNMIEIQVMFK